MTELLRPDEFERRLRQIGAERYHSQHPFHELLHEGKLTQGQVQAWVLNRFYYQRNIPLKDASLMSRAEVRSSAGNGSTGSSTMTARRPAKAASTAG